jgi:hypothetical protein
MKEKVKEKPNDKGKMENYNSNIKNAPDVVHYLAKLEERLNKLEEKK